MPVLRHAQKRPKPVSAPAGSRSHFDEKTTPPPEKRLCTVGNPNSRQPHERAREGRSPLAPRPPRGCRGAERPTLAPSETKSSLEQPFAPSKASISTEAVSCIVGNPNSRRTSPGRAREGHTPRAPRHPRGCRGAERPTPTPSETKSSSEQPFAPPKTSISTEAVSCIVGNRNSRRTSPLRRRKPASPPKPFPASSEIQIPAEPALCAAENQHLHRSRFLHRRKSKFPSNQPSGERERVATLSHPVTRGSVRERSAPRPRRRKQRPQKDNLLRREPISPPEQPRRAREGVNPLDFQSIPATCAAGSC